MNRHQKPLMWVESAIRKFRRDTITAEEIERMIKNDVDEHGQPFNRPQWLTKPQYRLRRGVYRLPLTQAQKEWLTSQIPEPFFDEATHKEVPPLPIRDESILDELPNRDHSSHSNTLYSILRNAIEKDINATNLDSSLVGKQKESVITGLLLARKRLDEAAKKFLQVA